MKIILRRENQNVVSEFYDNHKTSYLTIADQTS